MLDNDLDLLVEIFVGNGGQGHVGTGYPVARDRILTAGHVLFPDGWNSAAPVHLRWHYRRDSDSKAGRWQPVSRDRILWPPPERRGDRATPDAALIEHPFPKEVKSWRSLTARNHATRTPWESQGFADVGCREDDTRVAVPMSGQSTVRPTGQRKPGSASTPRSRSRKAGRVPPAARCRCSPRSLGSSPRCPPDSGARCSTPYPPRSCWRTTISVQPLAMRPSTNGARR